MIWNHSVALVRNDVLHSHFYFRAAVVLAFYGLTYNSISLGNKYLNFVISAAIELPSNAIGWLSMDRIGRRLTTGVPLLVGGGVLLLIMAVPSTPGKHEPNPSFWYCKHIYNHYFTSSSVLSYFIHYQELAGTCLI